MTRARFFVLTGLIAAGIGASPDADAAESYDNCNNFIDSIPATITSQGVWCLRKDLATAITAGPVISINTNNVTIDCNDFKIGGLAAGNGSSARGIYSSDRQNVTVRNCNIRGFNMGIYLSGGAGHLVENNRLDNNLYVGIEISGDNSRVRRNAVYDTGGSINGLTSTGIESRGSVLENIVSGLFVDRPGGFLTGIELTGAGSEARGNHILGFDMAARENQVIGLALKGSGQSASGNHISFSGGVANSTGIDSSNSNNFCLANTVNGFTTSIDSDCISGGNLTSP